MNEYRARRIVQSLALQAHGTILAPDDTGEALGAIRGWTMVDRPYGASPTSAEIREAVRVLGPSLAADVYHVEAIALENSEAEGEACQGCGAEHGADCLAGCGS